METSFVETFLSSFEPWYEKLLSSGRGREESQKRAWKRFQECGRVALRRPAYRGLPLRHLTTLAPPPASQPLRNLPSWVEDRKREKGFHLVTLNGEFLPAASSLEGLPQEVSILPFDKALSRYGTLMANRFQEALKREQDPFYFLNRALQAHGLLVYVPPGVVVEQPLYHHQIIQADTGFQPLFSHFFLILGKESHLDLTTCMEQGGKGTPFTSGVEEYLCEEGASLNHHSEWILQETGWYLRTLRSTLKQRATLSDLSWRVGKGIFRQDLESCLVGEGSEATLRGGTLLRGRGQTHLSIAARHLAPSTTSRQHYKTILYDQSRVGFEGIIEIAKGADQSDAFQLANHLPLSDQAIASSRPTLDIYADDVKASHGATLGGLDPASLFYLRSRGISQQVAEELMIAGFLSDLIDKDLSLSMRTDWWQGIGDV